MMDTYKIGRFIAACRKEKGMTQAQLAERLGVTAKTISRWENGNYMPDLSLLIPISEILEISLNELLNGERIVQENILQEEILEKTESSISGALQYSAEQIKKGKEKAALFVAFFAGFFILLLVALNHICFSEIPYHAGDVSQWKEWFPNHSAYEMAISDAGEPVFVDTGAALEKIKVDCSDAIEEIQEAYELLPLTKYTYSNYKFYAGYAKLLFKSDERVMEQRQQLLDFLDIYENSYEWKNLLLAGNEAEMSSESRTAMNKILQNAIILVLVFGILSLAFAFFAIIDWQKTAKQKKYSGETNAIITGLVRSSLFKNHITGEVPNSALIGWGVAQGEQYWGGMLKWRIPSWFPCVKYEIDGKEYIKISGEGVTKETWKVGQEVTMLYNPGNPQDSNIAGDPSLMLKTKQDFVIAGICAIGCLVAFLLLTNGLSQSKERMLSSTEETLIEDTEVADTTRKVVDNTNANIEVVAYEKEVELTGDDVADQLRFSIYVTEEYKDITDTYELLKAPFIGCVRVFDGASGEEIWKSEQVSGDRLGNQQISLVTKEGENYLLVSQIHEQMGDGCYFYSVYSLAEDEKLVDYYTVYFVLEDGGYRMRGNDNVRCEAVPDFKEHIENWLMDAELIIATDVMMERPDNILFSTTEKKISPKVYYDKVWARVKDQTATFEMVCPEVSFPTDENWIQKLVCWAVDEQIAVAKYYDAKAGGSCAFHAGSYTEKEMQEEVEYAHYLYPDNVEEHHYQAETINDEIIDIYGYEIPYENGEYKKTMMIFWTYHDKTYTIFGELAADADVISIIDTAVYIAERMN